MVSLYVFSLPLPMYHVRPRLQEANQLNGELVRPLSVTFAERMFLGNRGKLDVEAE